MNIKNFPKKLDSKTSCLRIKVPENLDLALEGLIRKVLREQPETDDIYAFAANYFETLVNLRDKSGKNDLNQKLTEKETNEMTVLANSFPRPSRNRFSGSAGKTKEKRRKHSAGKLTKPNSSKEKENLKENVEPKASLSKTKLDNLGRRKSEGSENVPLKNSSEGNIISSLAKTAGTTTERVLSSLPVTDNIQEDNQKIIQNEAGAKSIEDNTFVKDTEEPLKSEQISEVVNQELTNKVPDVIKTDDKLSQEETPEDEAENVKQVEETDKETVDKSEVSKKEEKLNKEISADNLIEDETNEIMKNKTEEEEDVMEKEIKNENISSEEDNEKVTKEDEKDAREMSEKSDNGTENANIKENKDTENLSVDDEALKPLKNTEEINLQLKQDEEDDRQVTATETNLVQEDISEISEKLDQGKEKKVIKNNESDNKMHDVGFNEKKAEAISENESTESKEEVVTAETAKSLNELGNSVKDETENLNDSIGSIKEGNKNDDNGTDADLINDLLESGKGEDDLQAKDKKNKEEEKLEIKDATVKEENKANEEEKKEEIKEVTSLEPLEHLEKNEKITAEADILKEKESTETGKDIKETGNKEEEIKEEKEKVKEQEKIKKDLETTEGNEEDKDYIETEDAKQLESSSKSESQKSENDEDKKEESEHQSLSNEKIADESVKLPEPEEIGSKSEEKNGNESGVTDATLDTQKLKPSASEEKKQENETVEDTKTKASLDNKISVEQSKNDAIRLEEPQLDNPENAKKEDESGEGQDGVANKTDSLADTETSADNACENKDEMNETDGMGTLEGKANRSLPSNEIENDASIKDQQNHQYFEGSDNQKEILEGTLDAKNAEPVDSVDDSKSSFVNDEQLKECQHEKDSADPQDDSQTKQIAAEKTEKINLEEKAGESEGIINSEKVAESEISQTEKEKQESIEELPKESEAVIEPEVTEATEIAKNKENEASTAESETTEEQSSDQFETHKTKRSVTDTETVQENTEKPVEEASDHNVEISSEEKHKDEEKVEILSESNNVLEEELCSVVDTNETRSVEETKETEEEIPQSESAPEEELCTVVDVNETRRVQENDKAEKIEESRNVPEEELCSVVDADEILRVQGADVKESEKPQSENTPEEELCSVVDINEIRRVQEADVIDKEKKENLQEDESGTVADKIQVITVEEKADETEEASPQEENVPLKTIKTHYYDTLQVPETNIKEYRVKPLPEDVTFLPSRENRHSIIRAYQFEKETEGKELWTLIGNTDTSENETENESDYQRLETDELMTPSSVTSMAVSDMSIYSINETFLDSERFHSMFDKRYQLQGDADSDPNKTEVDSKTEERKEVEEIIEKKAVGRSVAVPMTPRNSLETLEEANENLESLKILKEKPKGKKGLPPKEKSSSNDRSTDSENFAFISVDIETVIGTQEIDEDENKEDEGNKISGEVPVEVEIETKVEVVPEETDEGDEKETPEQDLSDINWNAPSQNIQNINDRESFLEGNEPSVETTETTSSSALTEIKRFDSARRNFTRSSTQNLLTSQSLDKSMKIGVAEEFVKRKKFVKTKSLSSLREGANDREIWRKIEIELEEAATKIQSQFRSYRKKKKLQRGDAIQITSESSRSITPVEPEVQHQLASGEFHDSIVLSIFPR